MILNKHLVHLYIHFQLFLDSFFLSLTHTHIEGSSQHWKSNEEKHTNRTLNDCRGRTEMGGIRDQKRIKSACFPLNTLFPLVFIENQTASTYIQNCTAIRNWIHFGGYRSVVGRSTHQTIVVANVFLLFFILFFLSFIHFFFSILNLLR